MANKQQDHVAALDLGSAKTRVLISELLGGNGDGASRLRFAGFGEVESRGWRKGSITDLGEVTACVKEASEQAEKMAGVAVESAVAGIGGPHIQGVSASCGLTVSLRPRELTREDIRRLMDTAKDVPLSRDREILHLVPEEFVLDSHHGIQDPIGMQASYLAVKAHIITGSMMAAANIVTAVNRAGILVETTVFEALAAAEEVLSNEERELGALVIVLGGGTTEIAAYQHGSLRLASVIPVGGDHFTNDVGVGLHTSVTDAEILKQTMGSVLSKQSSHVSSIEVPGLSDQQSRFVPHRALSEILESRAEELLCLIRDELRRSGLDRGLGAGAVLCGGGARLGGICDLTEQVLGTPARLGLPPKIIDMPEELDSPEYATVVGLLLYAYRLWRMRNPARSRSTGSRWKMLLAGRA
ncbi:MAG: cell division protein FtsA [Acidobacteria bacterium]|nr:cell division protein FtsA [Acidobacteriota bacterium]